jgi:hypothetical protein
MRRENLAPWAWGPVREETVVGGVRLCDLEAEICSFVGVCGRRCVVLQELDVGVCLNDLVRPIVPARRSAPYHISSAFPSHRVSRPQECCFW